MSEQLENAAITLKETAADMRSYLDGFDFDPDKLESLQARLSFLIALERRYGKSMDEVLRDRDQWREELASIAFEDEERGKLERAVDESVVTLGKAAEVLTASRKKGARSLDRSMTTELGQLMMKGARFRTDVTIEPDEESRLLVDGRSVRPLEDGVDVVEFHVRTNPGETEGSVAEVASSGELSRIALALKRITTLERAAGVLVFDELDAGVGADLGEMIAAKIGALAERYQIICITHMPQIAARGRRHLVVRKETVKGRTYTTVEPVDAEERRAEIARMLGGAEGSEKRLALAAEMLKIQEKSSPNVRP
jgi:DNA repair protein RecN (Recombination protein N)